MEEEHKIKEQRESKCKNTVEELPEDFKEVEQASARDVRSDYPIPTPLGFSSKPDIPDEILVKWQKTVDLMATLAGVPAALIMKVHPSEIEVFVSSTTEGNPYEKGERVDLNTGLYCETVMAQRAQLLVPDARKDPDWAHNPDIELGMVSYLGLPLVWLDGEIFGTICVLDTKENPYSDVYQELLRQFNETIEMDLRLLVDIAERKKAQEALRKARDELEMRVAERTAELARANEELQAEITEHKRAEEALRESEEKYRLLVGNANEAIIVAQDGMLRFFNPKAMEITGYSQEELASKPFIEIVHSDDREMAVKYYLKCLKGEGTPQIYALRIVDKDGNTKWLESNAVLITWEGTPATLSFISDITARKRAEEELRQSFEKLQKTLEGTIRALISAVERRDPYTAGHQRRVAQLACAIAKEMGLPEERIEGMRMAGLIHDLGKISVPAEILSKPGRINDLEFTLIQAHSQVGHDILNGTIEFPWPVAEMVLQHHERMDGSGYPQGLSGEEILLEARILAVADVVEAMSSHRPYRPARGIDQALEEISQNQGILYDPEVVDACLKLFAEKRFKFE